MATHCTIAMKRDDGRYISIYCHSDGYLDYTGAILNEHYSDPAKVEKLINLGDISILAPEVEPPADAVHNFDLRLRNVTVAYHRDRGERKRIDTSNGRSSVPWNEHMYFFEGGVWMYGDLKLSDVLINRR